MSRGPRAGIADSGETMVGRVFPRRSVTAETRALSRVSNVRAAWALARQWIVIAAAAAVALHVQHWAVWVAAGAVVATRQMTLMVIGHEAVHHHLFTSRRLSVWIADWLCFFPMLITTAGYGHQHLEHHRYTSTPDDPYWMNSQRDESTWIFPKGALRTVRVLACDLLGLHALKWVRLFGPWMYPVRLLGRAQPRITPAEHMRWMAFQAIALAFLALTNGWIPWLLLWLVPMLTLVPALFRMRAVGEHPYTEATNEILDTRYVEGTLLERLSIAPLNINYHLAHHLFPSVPYYHLPAMQKLIAATGIYQQGRNYFTSYLGLRRGVLGWLIGAQPAPPPAGNPSGRRSMADVARGHRPDARAEGR